VSSSPVNRGALSSRTVATGGVAGPTHRPAPEAVGERLAPHLHRLRESVLGLAGLVESQIDDTLVALRTFDLGVADRVRTNDRALNELLREIREQVVAIIATRRPEAPELRSLMALEYVATELERMGDYLVRIARQTSTLAGLQPGRLRPEFGLMGELASRQVRDILDALVEEDVVRAREVAARDDEIDRLYHRLFDALVTELATTGDPSDALRTVMLIDVAHDLERLGDRVVNVAEDILFLASGQVVELG
jgi:phosphate transport system protein